MKRLIFLAVLISWCAAASAQFTIRPQVGINSSSLKNISSAEFKNGIGFQFGVDAQIGNRFYFQPGIFWEGTNNTITEANNEETELKVNYIRIPAVFGYKIIAPDDGRFFGMRLFTGPNMAFVTNKDLSEGSLIDEGDFNDFVFGWDAGLGFDIAIIFVDLGYRFGLSEFVKVLDEGSRNNLFFGNAGIRIRF